MSFGYLGDLFESFYSAIVVIWKNRVSICLYHIVTQHEITSHNDADVAFSPALVQKFIFLFDP